MAPSRPITPVRHGQHVTGKEREDLTAQFVAWYEGGASIREIGQRSGRAYQTVRNMLTEARVPLRPRGGHGRQRRTSDLQPILNAPEPAASMYGRLVGEELRRWRRKRGWSREYMCRPMGIAIQTLAAYERGTRSLSVGRLAELCSRLGTTPHEVTAAADAEMEKQFPSADCIKVDLTMLLLVGGEKLAPARRWAEALLRASPDGVSTVRMLDQNTVGRLAQVCGMTADTLTDLLERTVTA